MEISILTSDSIRIKGKTSVIVINPQNKSVPLHAAILIGLQQGKNFVSENGITIDGPGEYEVGGVKISGTRGKDGVVYSMSVDGIDVVIGTLTALASVQQKIKEHNIAVALCMSEEEVSFMTSIAVNTAIFYGLEAKKAIEKFAKEGVLEVNKYTTTLDKLPQEMETVLLA